MSVPLQASETQTRTVYIETLGCQMNVNDSELMLGLLAKDGFVPVTKPHEADLAIINTCQIRANAEDKAYSYLGFWRKLKLMRPDMKIVMAGCVAQQTQGAVVERAPYVDIVVGTQNIHDLPGLVQQAFDLPKPRSIIATDRQKPKSTYDYVQDVAPVRDSKISAWVTIIEGCDYFCTYCVVPYTRGRQISRPQASIIEEVKRLADTGYSEITLLGQTVDAYGKDFTGTPYGLAHLLEDLHKQVPEMARIRFMTSHPLDLSDDIIQAVADLPRVMEHIHIPMQAGNNQVLERMRRGYTREQYFELIDRIRDRIPNVAISSDFITGFPGETDEQFEETLDAIARSRFDAANTAAYSARKQTPAGLWENKGEGVISDAVKQERLQRVNDVVTHWALMNNLAYQDQVVEVLVEGTSKRKKFDRWRGRTRTNKTVNFDAPPTAMDLTGQRVWVKVEQVQAWSLQGLLGQRKWKPDCMIVYLGLGSNLGDRVGAIQQAIRFLTDSDNIRLLSASSFYETEPVGFKDQEWFVNVAVAIETALTPEALLARCLEIEKALGRVRSSENRNGPRTIDIDILFYGDLAVNEPELTIPHPRVQERACMLVPLLEVNPRLVHPILQRTVEQLHDDLAEPEEVLLYGTRGQLGF